MQLKYLGTAAAEGVPGLFCICDVCIQARKLGGRNIRTRSQALVDGKLLIDFPPDTLAHVIDYKMPLENLDHCLLTHGHSDHFYPPDFKNLRTGYALREEGRVFNLYATSEESKDLEEIIQSTTLSKEGKIKLHHIKPFKKFFIEDYSILPLPANHASASNPVLFIINRGGKNLFYGNDTGYLPEEVWEFLDKSKIVLDLVSLDCTAGLLKGWRDYHMGFDINLEVRDRLKSQGNTNRNTIFVAHHFSHNGGANYCDFAPMAETYGFLTSYDGMEIDF